MGMVDLTSTSCNHGFGRRRLHVPLALITSEQKSFLMKHSPVSISCQRRVKIFRPSISNHVRSPLLLSNLTSPRADDQAAITRPYKYLKYDITIFYKIHTVGVFSVLPFVNVSRIESVMDSKKVAIVVGASRGIGRQVAIDLAKNGYAGNYISSPSLSISSNAEHSTQSW